MSDLTQFEADMSKLQESAARGSRQLAAETTAFVETHREFVANNKAAVLAEAVERFNQGQLYVAEQACRLVLQSGDKEIKALHLLATIATRLGHHEDAVDLLLDCLDVNPNIPFIRNDLANAFFMTGNFQLAVDLSDELLLQDPKNTDYAALKAASLVKLGQYEKSTHTYEQILESTPHDSRIRLFYGIALRIIGRSDEAISAFRKVLDQEPTNGEAYWNLANLKTFRFENSDVEAMRSALENDQIEDTSKVYTLFALGKAMNDATKYDEAFQYYSEANKLAKTLGNYTGKDTSELVKRCMQVFTRHYFDAHEGGCDAPDPIFIVGLPRSGSTLLEQILGNHSAIDATMELSEIAAMARSLNNPNRTGASARYPGILKGLQAEELRRLGEEYLKRTRCFRGDKPYFVDKAPQNFLHIGLIASILPNAKIIDARRNPYATGFSVYTQYFARGTTYAYDLGHIGLYYKDYLSLMNHWHEVMPGRVLTVQYEDVIENMEREVRRILEYCGLDFEPACLEFYKSKRAVATVSSEQVRQPIYDSALEHWKNYEKHLAPLKAALESRPD